MLSSAAVRHGHIGTRLMRCPYCNARTAGVVLMQCGATWRRHAYSAPGKPAWALRPCHYPPTPTPLLRREVC